MERKNFSISPHPSSHKVYTPSELKFIEVNYQEYSDEWIAKKLNRAEFSVAWKRIDLGLFRKSGRTPLPKPEPVLMVDIEQEIKALVNFIETTHSDVWREIANTRRKQLLNELKYFKHV